MINAQPARNAVHGAARAKPPAARASPVTIGPTTAPRLRALLLKASIVPRAVSDSSATMVWMPGTPNQVPNAQTAKTSERDRQGDGRHGQQQHRDHEAGEPDEHGSTRPDARDESARQSRRGEPDHPDQDVDQARLGGRHAVGHVDELTDIDEQPEAAREPDEGDQEHLEGAAVGEDRPDRGTVGRACAIDPAPTPAAG